MKEFTRQQWNFDHLQKLYARNGYELEKRSYVIGEGRNRRPLPAYFVMRGEKVVYSSPDYYDITRWYYRNLASLEERRSCSTFNSR